MAWVYILECNDGSYYVGSTVHLDRRVWEHQNGLGAAYTRHRRPVTLVWAVDYERIDQAFAFEKQVQGWSRRKRQALIDGRWDALPDLASRSWRAMRLREGLPVEPPPPEARDRPVERPRPAPRPVDPDDPWAPPGEVE